MSAPFRLPSSVVDSILEIDDVRDQSRVLTVLFGVLVKGEIPDVRGERPIVRLMLSVCNKQIEAWERRAAQYRESKKRSSSGDAPWNDCGIPHQRKRDRDEGKMKEKASPTPPYKEKEERKERTENKETREVVEFHKGSTDEMFAEFWEAYPRKVAKKAAESAFRTAVGGDRVSERKRASLFSTIMGGLRAAKASSQWTRDGGRYIPHPSTWLHQERWNDELDGAPSADTVEAERRMSRADEVAMRLTGRRTA